MPNSTILMHQPSGGIGGTATDIKIQAEQMRHVKKTLSQLTARHTGQSLEKVLKDADRDHWYTAQEAKEYGFVDHVVASAEETPSGTVAS
jgi:ATP-dependent Clp protease protease subunit